MITVLPLKEAEALFKFYFNGDAVFGKQDRHHRHKEFYWTPTTADVAQAELAMANYAKTKTDVPFITKPHSLVLTEYFRQYAGVARGENKCILVNCFAGPDPYSYVSATMKHKSGDDWHSRAVLVCDGGSAFFHASYNLETHQIENVQFNGIG